MFNLDNIKNIVVIAKSVLADNMLAYAKSIANNLYGVNNKDCGCGSICGMRSLYQFITQAAWRQLDMIDDDNYQLLINQIFRCMSLQPDYYKYTGGVNVINATVSNGHTDVAGGGTSWAEFNMPLVPPKGSTVIPIQAEQQEMLKSAVIITILREGVGMQDKDSSRNNYYSFDANSGKVTIKTAANGKEIFQVIYKRIIDGSSSLVQPKVTTTQYTYFKYSNDGGHTFTSNNGNDPGKYIGNYVSDSSTASTDVNDYTWVELQGNAGIYSVATINDLP